MTDKEKATKLGMEGMLYVDINLMSIFGRSWSATKHHYAVIDGIVYAVGNGKINASGDDLHNITASCKKIGKYNPEKKYTFEGGEVVMNYEVDRIQIFFTDRPSKDELNAWKEKGLNTFNWSPSNNCWQRKITPNAIWFTKRMLPQLTKATN
jgi:hypothetical protein